MATPKKMGRPKIQIDRETFERFCEVFCTEADIAYLLKCSPDTILRWCQETYGTTFAEVYKRLSIAGKASLRRKQFDVAMSGNATLLIWLGKQHLDQTEKVVQKTELTATANVKVEESKALVEEFKSLLSNSANERAVQ